MSKKYQISLGIFIALLCIPKNVFAMHIMEGFLPPKWCIAWGVICIPFLVVGLFSIKEKIRLNRRTKMLIAMAVVGPIVSYFLYKLLKKFNVSQSIVVFSAAMMGDLITYVTTSIQLGLAFPDATGGITASIMKFMEIFAVTQLPLAISEGILTVIVFNLLNNYNKDELIELNVIAKEI